MGRNALVILGVLVAVVLVGALAMSGTYNRLVQLDEQVKSQWSQVENVYQRRADLIPNLVETVKGAANFERGTLEAVVNARAKATQITLTTVPTADQLKAYQAAQDGLSGALSRLLAVVENYPQLTATQNFRDLQTQLEGTENRIAVERKRYNEVAQTYNAARRSFPAVFVAGLMGFGEKPYFEAAPGAEQPPKVDFGGAAPSR
jgi:LemA protein